jgi:2-polyprenyl-6-methoxyphenol hydroxylase-like FAD-dependent oxidoreductase
MALFILQRADRSSADLLIESVGGSEMKILVVGGGIAGLSAAIALRQRGFEVDLVEKSSAGAELGVGIILQGNALRALASLGVLDAVMAAGQEFTGRTFFDENGENARYLPADHMAGPNYPAAMGITRAAYRGILTEAAEAARANICYGTTVVTLDQDGSGVDIVLSNGNACRYDLVIGADGLRSTTRRYIFGDVGSPRYSGQAAWRVSFPRPANVDTLQSYDQGSGDRVGLVPLRKDLMYMFVTDTTSSARAPDGDLREVLGDKLKNYGGLIGKLRDSLPGSDQILWRPFEVVHLPAPWYRGRVLIIGDAAHATTAHLGQGGAMANEDALVIAEELAGSESVESALAGFMRRRIERVSSIQRWSEQLCRWEIEKTPDADAFGLRRQALEFIRESI